VGNSAAAVQKELRLRGLIDERHENGSESRG
jgi:hypothetical protein